VTYHNFQLWVAKAHAVSELIGYLTRSRPRLQKCYLLYYNDTLEQECYTYRSGHIVSSHARSHAHLNGQAFLHLRLKKRLVKYPCVFHDLRLQILRLTTLLFFRGAISLPYLCSLDHYHCSPCSKFLATFISIVVHNSQHNILFSSWLPLMLKLQSLVYQIISSILTQS